ncbi:MAG: metal-dependent hydrolase [Edaphobacter sp.]|uniref:metal-dependent hydrolase n=1 Tax=Edaphobacter sp. TaxID=1934404 RepID=UPI00239D4619|nr:metal-dependent hydrolase [Edaphobacter sp.]MDE1176428.1 metal-dependent hydrolase [Edaphobacter sp.]
MEPVTHFMTGAVLSRAGFNRKAAYATLAMTLAAEAPDLDVLWSLKGPVAGFEHHRGWTHSFLGIPFEALVVVGFIWLIHRWRLRRNPSLKLAAPLSWLRLYLLSVVALLSHILLDWTNNYGVRPFAPFNPRWYAGSFVFIFEPILFLLLLAALVAPALFGLISSEVGTRRPAFRGRAWAIAALSGIVALWGLRYVERLKAIDLARSAEDAPSTIQRATADPYPFNPFRWQTVVDLPHFYRVSTVNTLRGEVSSSQQTDIYYKPPSTLAVLEAKRSWLGHVYLDWSQYPLVNEAGTDRSGLTAVTFRDLRFLYDDGLLSGHTPLMGVAYINSNRRIDHLEMDGHDQP